jgi:hypothetical protein
MPKALIGPTFKWIHTNTKNGRKAQLLSLKPIYPALPLFVPKIILRKKGEENA